MWGLPDYAKSYVGAGHPLLAIRSVLRTPPAFAKSYVGRLATTPSPKILHRYYRYAFINT